MRDVFYKSPVGNLLISISNNHIDGISFVNKSVGTEYKQDLFLKKVKDQLNEYFLGERKIFNLPFSLVGTSFQKKVWRSLIKIPYGQTKSYKWVAEMIGRPKACRAVGNAVRKNSIPIIIPCHRVIRATGKIGKYSWGSHIKQKLLLLEKQQLDN